jgi:hypothetical protein
MSSKCCTSNACNGITLDQRPDVERCYVCISSSSRNCADGKNLGYSDSQGCPSGTRYCMVILVSILLLFFDKLRQSTTVKE